MLWRKGSEYRPVTDPFGLGGAGDFLPSSAALNSPVRTQLLLLPRGLWGKDADVCYPAQLRHQGCNAMNARIWNGKRGEEGICAQSQDVGSASTSPTLFSPRQGKHVQQPKIHAGCLQAA